MAGAPIEELLVFVARGLVEKPDEVRVTRFSSPFGRIGL